MKKSEKIAGIIVLLGFSFLMLYGLWRKKQIEKDPVYVLAKVYKVLDSENGLLYYFKYYLDSTEYESSLKGFIKMQDSTIVLKISEKKPKLWKRIDGKVPKCLLYIDTRYQKWKTFPQCK